MTTRYHIGEKVWTIVDDEVKEVMVDFINVRKEFTAYGFFIGQIDHTKGETLVFKTKEELINSL